MRAFNGEGLLYDLVHFSAGNLFLPSELQGCREGDKVRLTWKNENVVRVERLRGRVVERGDDGRHDVSDCDSRRRSECSSG